ncbi:MAG: NUDIX hydrolase [Candidatus Zixiibacteriota bacterium]
MYITDDILCSLSERYGPPRIWRVSVFAFPDEFAMIRNSQKGGRNHDVTVYGQKDGRIIVNAKHFYPPGLFRAPSGGVEPGEDFVEGAKREMREETGCEMELEKFILRTAVDFYLMLPDGTITDRVINWRSFVFTARYVDGDFNFSDRHEIREVSLAAWEDFESFSRTMRQTAIGGFHYRAALHDQVRRWLHR